MPSGNAIYTYTGPEESTDVQGQIFLKDQPKHITDQGVIAVCAARKDFAGGDVLEMATSAYEKREGDLLAIGKFAAAVVETSAPAKPKKAKSK